MNLELFFRNISFLMVTIALTLCFEANAFRLNRFKETKLIANTAGYGAPVIDPRLVNPWGLIFDKDGNLIVADNDSSFLATSYWPNGDIRLFNILGSFNPTGLQANHRPCDFLIGTLNHKRAASLLFATELGTIMGFNKEVNPHNAQVVIDSSSRGSVYKGLALGTSGGNQFIFAADFYNSAIDIFDSNFNFVKSVNDPNIPLGFAPFNIENINGLLYVTYAMQKSPDNHDDQAGPGNGFVDIFDTDGNFIKRLISQGALNSPWGLALAPAGFGPFVGALLVGNFGDGRINAYHPDNGTFLGTLKDGLGHDIVIEGLWSLKFFPSSCSCPRLYFTSGPNDESDGLIGMIEAIDN